MDDQFNTHGRRAAHSEAFKTPDQIASEDSGASGFPILNSPEQESSIKSPKPRGNRKVKLWPPNRLGWIIIAVVVILITAFCIWFFTRSTKPVAKPVVAAKTVPVKPLTVASTLTGLQVDPSINKLPITAVMIENSTDARPQSGLSQAGVVFEAVAEGGVTRFVAIFQSNSSALSVGPVRSARPYFISWMLGFDAAYAHVGGSPEGLADISSWGVKNMDEFANGGSYQRISSRAAPHNVYTTLATLYKLEQTKGYTSSTFTSWPRKADQPLKTATVNNINFALSGSLYNVNYTYNKTYNTYMRNVGGAPEIDANTNKQVAPNVVISIVVPESQGPLDATGAYYSEYQTVGSGTAYIFQDGGETTGQWSKSSNNANISFTSSDGKTIPLNAGQTWITAVTSTSAVKYN